MEVYDPFGNRLASVNVNLFLKTRGSASGGFPVTDINVNFATFVSGPKGPDVIAPCAMSEGLTLDLKKDVW